MGFLIKFALKNLNRHRRRTLITASALAVGLSVFLLMDSLILGADTESQRNLIWYEFASARIMSSEGSKHPEKLTLKNPLLNPQFLVKKAESMGYKATQRLAFEAQLAVIGGEIPASRVVRAWGVDPQNDPRVFPQKEIKITGQWFLPGQAKVVLGQWIAEDLGVTLGQGLNITTRTKEGSYQVIDVEVSGIISTPSPTLNRGGVFLPLDLVQTQLEMEGLATEVDLSFPPGTSALEESSKLTQALTGQEVVVLPWQTLAKDFLALSTTKQKSSSAILFLVFIIAAVGVGNTLLLSFYERKTEIGMLRALGMPDRRLFWAFIIEAGGIGLIGSALGLILGAVFVMALSTWGIDFSLLLRQTDIGYPISGVLYGAVSPGSFVAAGILGVVLSSLCAIGPTRRALKLPITESLRAEG